ncbi:MAG: sigma-70 family RNA polymerase sigma factor, partial [Acidobacteriales bacterium]|nr:sigma-70 family RNA polymerase sigma factor [Terriglobales bacterium]
QSKLPTSVGIPELRPPPACVTLQPQRDVAADPEARPQPHPDMWLYRDRTVGMLRRYMRLSVEVGRLPSLLGREFFRTRVTSYHVSTFEDGVIFVHDVEQCLEKLDAFEKKLVARIVLQNYTHEEAGRLLGCGRRTVGRRFSEAIDRLSEAFLEGGLLARLPVTNPIQEKACQEGESDQIELSGSIDGE